MEDKILLTLLQTCHYKSGARKGKRKVEVVIEDDEESKPPTNNSSDPIEIKDSDDDEPPTKKQAGSSSAAGTSAASSSAAGTSAGSMSLSEIYPAKNDQMPLSLYEIYERLTKLMKTNMKTKKRIEEDWNDQMPSSLSEIYEKLTTLSSSIPFYMKSIEEVDSILKTDELEKGQPDELVIKTPYFRNGYFELYKARLILAIKNLNKKELKLVKSILKEEHEEMYAYDDLINAYVGLLAYAIPTIGVISSNIIDSKTQSVKMNWERTKKELFDKDKKPLFSKIFIPVHKKSFLHWALLVVDFSKKRIEFYDSLYDKVPHALFDEIKSYIVLCYMKQFPEDADDIEDYMEEWTVIDFGALAVKVTPQQSGVDCGFFVMELAKYIAMNWEITADKPNKDDMKKIRERCVWELKNLQLLNV